MIIFVLATFYFSTAFWVYLKEKESKAPKALQTALTWPLILQYHIQDFMRKIK